VTIVVDIGNARIKWARVRSGELSEFGEALHGDDYELALETFARTIGSDVSRIIATNVAGKRIEARLTELAGGQWGVSPEWIESAAERYGVTCGYAKPERLGADRWVAVLAAYALADGSACVIDAGTAVTFDAVDADGRHLGGLIMAGPRLAAAALSRETSDIGGTMTSQAAPVGLDLLGRDTEEAVAHGAMLGVAAAIDRALGVVAESLTAEPLVLLTGGYSPALLPWLESKVQYREHLVLEGLALVVAKG